MLREDLPNQLGAVGGFVLDERDRARERARVALRARARTEWARHGLSLAEELARNDQPLDLARAFADRQSFTSRKYFSAG